MTTDRRRRMPSWMPSPIDSVGLFLFEVVAVVTLGVGSLVVAAIALWIA